MFGADAQSVISRAGIKRVVVVAVFVLDDAAAQKGSWARIQITDEQFTQEALNALLDVPAWWGSTPGIPPKDKLPKEAKLPMSSMIKLVRYVTWKLFGHVGSKNGVLHARGGMVENARTH